MKEKTSTSPLKVLIVDDSAFDYQFLKALLPGAEFSVEYAASYEEALQLLDCKFDVFLVDYNLGGKKGTDIIDLLTAKEASAARLIITSHEDEVVDREARAMGADDFLVKGQFDAKQLKRAIGYALEKRRGEARLLRSVHRFQAIFEGAIDGMVLAGPDGLVHRANESARRLIPALRSGVRIEEVLGEETWRRLQVEETHRSLSIDYGQRRLEVSSTGRLASEQRVFILRDVTERFQAEQALARSEHRLRAFLSHTPTVAFIKDAGGRYLFANSRFGELMKSSPQEIVGKTDFELWPEQIAAQFRQHDKEIMDGGEAREYREITRVGDDVREWLVAKFPLEAEVSGEPCVAGLAFDVSEQRKLEIQLQQIQKMDALGRLAGGVAHDFNNLLSVILGNTELLSGSDRVTAEERELLQEVKNAGERAAKLTKKLLTLGKQQPLEERPLELYQELTEMKRLLRRLVREDIDLRFELTEDCGRVKADPGNLEQLILNLVVNARDAIDGTGSIIIGCGARHVSDGEQIGLEAGKYAHLYVQDNGCGMPSSIQARVFEPFFTTKGSEGTGLGLATVYGIVERAGGKVWFESEDGAGTTFHVLLPRTDQPRGEVEQPKSALSGEHALTVMVVEDEASIRNLAVRLLKQNFHQVISCADGEEALRYFNSNAGEIDLLITDVIMPKLRGTELVRKAREIEPNLKVLFMSGYTEDFLELDSYSTFLSKPFTGTSFRQAVERTLALNNSPSSS